jgi:hypothetical protein
MMSLCTSLSIVVSKKMGPTMLLRNIANHGLNFVDVRNFHLTRLEFHFTRSFTFDCLCIHQGGTTLLH